MTVLQNAQGITLQSLTSPGRTYAQKTRGEGNKFWAEREALVGPDMSGGAFSRCCINHVALDISATKSVDITESSRRERVVKSRSVIARHLKGRPEDTGAPGELANGPQRGAGLGWGQPE